MEKCFFCQQQKSKFNVEHFFPESIGGLFKNRICIECNSTLNKYIDRPFLANPYIAHKRQTLNLVKQSTRKILNPLKGLKLKDGQDEYTLFVNPDGTIERRLIPKIVYPTDNDYSKGISIQIDMKHIDQVDHIKEKIAKKIGVEKSLLIEGKRIVNSTPQSNLVVGFPNNPLIFEDVKILVEFALKYCPEFINTKASEKYINFLLHKTPIDDELMFMMSVHPELTNHVTERITSLFYNQLSNCHAVFITFLKGVGLIGIIKLFDFVHTIIFSPDVIQLQKPYYFFVNNFVKKTKSIHCLQKFANVSIIIDSNKICNYSSQESLLSNLIKDGSNPFIYDQNSTLICKNIFDIPQLFVPKIIEGNYFNKLDCIYDIDSKFYFKTNKNILVPIHELKYFGCIEKIPDVI